MASGRAGLWPAASITGSGVAPASGSHSRLSAGEVSRTGPAGTCAFDGTGAILQRLRPKNCRPQRAML